MNQLSVPGVAIRDLEPGDVRRIREIACETAFSGIASKRTDIDRNLLADLLTLYYVNFEPGAILVAEMNGRVGGYIMGSIKPCRFRIKTVQIFASRIIPGLILRRYKKIFKCLPLLLFGIAGLMKGERDPEMKSEYPAHLHINVDGQYQSAGIGSMLMSAWLQYLGRENVKGACLSTISVNGRAIRFFENHGFKLQCRYRSTFWSYVHRKTVYVEILARKIE